MGATSGFDAHTEESIVSTAERLNAVGVDVPFLSILTPFHGLKRLTGNLPAEAPLQGQGLIDHPSPERPPVRLAPVRPRRAAEH